VKIDQQIKQGEADRFEFRMANDGPQILGASKFIYLMDVVIYYDKDDKSVVLEDVNFITRPMSEIAGTNGMGQGWYISNMLNTIEINNFKQYCDEILDPYITKEIENSSSFIKTVNVDISKSKSIEEKSFLSGILKRIEEDSPEASDYELEELSGGLSREFKDRVKSNLRRVRDESERQLTGRDRAENQSTWTDFLFGKAGWLNPSSYSIIGLMLVIFVISTITRTFDCCIVAYKRLINENAKHSGIDQISIGLDREDQPHQPGLDPTHEFLDLRDGTLDSPPAGHDARDPSDNRKGEA
jgi:hypothetical protein